MDLITNILIIEITDLFSTKMRGLLIDGKSTLRADFHVHLGYFCLGSGAGRMRASGAAVVLPRVFAPKQQPSH